MIMSAQPLAIQTYILDYRHEMKCHYMDKALLYSVKFIIYEPLSYFTLLRSLIHSDGLQKLFQIHLVWKLLQNILCLVHVCKCEVQLIRERERFGKVALLIVCVSVCMDIVNSCCMRAYSLPPVWYLPLPICTCIIYTQTTWLLHIHTAHCADNRIVTLLLPLVTFGIFHSHPPGSSYVLWFWRTPYRKSMPVHRCP